MNILIEAGPGCGKTTVLSDIYRYMKADDTKIWMENRPHLTQEQRTIYEFVRERFPEECKKKAAYIAYNVPIKEELEKKIHKDAEARTSHGWGYQVLNKRYGYLKINSNRMANIIEAHTGKLMKDMNFKDRAVWFAVGRYMDKLKSELLDPTLENLELLHSKYDDLVSYIPTAQIVQRILEIVPRVKTIDKAIGIDYIDQVWLALFALKEPIYDFGLVDECQDLDPARLLLAQRMCKNLVFVGDPNQAINAWNGADAEAFTKIRAICDSEFPLKESFRCPPNICNYINGVKPNAKVRPSPGKEPGVVLRVDLDEFITMLNKTDASEYKKYLVMCRYNAPMIGVCLALIKAGIPAYILGEQLITSLCYLVKNRKAATLDELEDKLDSYYEGIAANAEEWVADIIRDKVDCIRAVIPNCKNVEDVEVQLKKFLKPSKGTDFITMSTIHRAKGLEAEVAVVLYPPVEHPKAKKPLQIEQEKNLHFVAASRTKRDLIWVTRE